MDLSNPQTVADSKRRFYAAYPHVIPGLYRRVVDELLVELHLLAGQAGFDADSLFAMGLTQVFDNLMQGFKPAERRDALFAAICSGAGLKADQLRKDAKQLREQLVPLVHKVLLVQEERLVLKVHKVMTETLVVQHFIILLNQILRMQIQVQEI